MRYALSCSSVACVYVVGVGVMYDVVCCSYVLLMFVCVCCGCRVVGVGFVVLMCVRCL